MQGDAKEQKNLPYPQGIFFRQAFKIANQVDVKSIVSRGLKGSAIREALTKQKRSRDNRMEIATLTIVCGKY